MKVKRTARGFDLCEFKDSNGEPCSLQVSSSVTPHLWLGCDNNTKPHHVTGEFISPRMHLTRNQARQLMRHISKWLHTGFL